MKFGILPAYKVNCDDERWIFFLDTFSLSTWFSSMFSSADVSDSTRISLLTDVLATELILVFFLDLGWCSFLLPRFRMVEIG